MSQSLKTRCPWPSHVTRQGLPSLLLPSLFLAFQTRQVSPSLSALHLIFPKAEALEHKYPSASPGGLGSRLPSTDPAPHSESLWAEVASCSSLLDSGISPQASLPLGPSRSCLLSSSVAYTLGVSLLASLGACVLQPRTGSGLQAPAHTHTWG